MAQFEAKEIGARIAQARREAGLTQEQLAELAPFSTRSLQDYERGLVIPYRQMRDLARLLDRPVEWFLRGEKEDEPQLLERLESIDQHLSEIKAMLSLLVPAEQLAAARAEAAAARDALPAVAEDQTEDTGHARRASGSP